MPKPDEFIRCPKCDSKWFDVVQASSFKDGQSLILGQAPLATVSFPVLRCLKCGEMTEPYMMQNQVSPLYKKHNEFIRDMEDADKTKGQ